MEYISALIKAFLSVIVMKLLFSISITIFFNDFTVNGLIWSITGLIMVNKGSALINQFIIPQQGGSGILHSSMSQAISGKIQNIFNPIKK